MNFVLYGQYCLASEIFGCSGPRFIWSVQISNVLDFVLCQYNIHIFWISFCLPSAKDGRSRPYEESAIFGSFGFRSIRPENYSDALGFILSDQMSIRNLWILCCPATAIFRCARLRSVRLA